MNPVMSQKAQECLTVKDGKKVKKVLDVETLLHKHKPDEVLQFLNQLLEEYEDKLKRLVIADKTNPEIDHTVVSVLRLFLAIRAIENENEQEAA
jgi:c-di-GMP-related signal transduction protein